MTFPHNFTKEYFSKIQVVFETARQDISSGPKNISGLCKSVLNLIICLRGVPYHNVHYKNTNLIVLIQKSVNSLSKEIRLNILAYETI